ncbi:hypothetical protein AAG570_007237 [Ranatra chinensis]|uniref:Chitin-binding type-2 domain-containing protein n=1 Tax=Ranatra chinensis TaxID=642074 RepID=A0ABD0XVB0_9HEMI
MGPGFDSLRGQSRLKARLASRPTGVRTKVTKIARREALKPISPHPRGGQCRSANFSDRTMNLNLCVTAAVLLVASAVATADSKCQENKRVPHPDSCRKYMRCTKGKWVEDSCPLIEHFDSVEATCRNLFAGTCGHPQCREGDVGPVVADCKKYKECTGGKWITQECNLLHYFNPVNKECEFR